MRIGKFEVLGWEDREKDAVRRKFDSQQDYEKEYDFHVGYGASGYFELKEKFGVITSFAKICKKLEAQGYKNLEFCNGGDDDWLIIDHNKRQFAFVEDLLCDEILCAAKRLTDLAP